MGSILGNRSAAGEVESVTVAAGTEVTGIVIHKGIAGRAVVLDIARLRGKRALERGETFTHEDLLAAAAAQGVACCGPVNRGAVYSRELK